MLPPIWREDTVKSIEGILGRMDAETWDSLSGVLIQSFDQILWAREHFEGREIIAGEGVYTWNSLARKRLSELGITTDTCPEELTQRQLTERGTAGSELVIYGRSRLMTTVQCAVKNKEGCLKERAGGKAPQHKANGSEFSRSENMEMSADSYPHSHLHWIRDRRGYEFPVVNDCRICTNYIYNSVPTDLRAEANLPESLRYRFTTESEAEVRTILRGRDQAMPITYSAAGFTEDGRGRKNVTDNGRGKKK